MAAVELDPLHDPLDAQIAGKKIGHDFVMVKVDINGISVFLCSELLHQPGLSYLTCALDDERFSSRAFLPLFQIMQSIAVHDVPPDR